MEFCVSEVAASVSTWIDTLLYLNLLACSSSQEMDLCSSLRK